MSRENKYLPPQLKNIVKEFRMIKNPDSCEIITQNGKRCKHATKYRFEDEVKDCGSYCSKHCGVWMEDLLKSLFYGDVVANGEKIKVNKFTIKNTDDGDNTEELIIEPKIAEAQYLIFEYRNDTVINLSRDDYKSESSFKSASEKFIKQISEKMCAWEQIYIMFIISKDNFSKFSDGSSYHSLSEYKDYKISSLNVGGIRGWKITDGITDSTIEKIYKIKG